MPEGGRKTTNSEDHPMGELGFNKIFGAFLAVALTVMGLRELSAMVFHGDGGHHYGEEYASANEWAEKNFAYRVNIAEAGGGGGEVIEEVYDLGLLLASADASRGERSFKAKCASCHSIEEGGANGTGPNLYDAMGGAKQHVASFNYSGALDATEGDWSWERMDAWLENPSRYARGTSMAFAGLKRDDERANVLAYLAQYSTKTQPMPEPLPAVTEEADAEGVTETAAGDEATVDGAVMEADTAGDIVEGATEAAEDAATEAEAALEDAIETAGDEGEAAVEAATDAAEEALEDTTGE